MDQAVKDWQAGRASSRDELLQRCLAALDSGDLRVGQRLPNERSLAETSGLSRSTVRAVLDTLERDGRIIRQVGRGTYVADGSDAVRPASAELAPAELTPAELMEFRLVTEPSLVELVVLTATDARLEELAAIVAQGGVASRWQEAEAADRAFHQALFDATGNRLFSELGRRLSEARESRSWLRLKEGSFSLEKWAVYHREHEVIVAALFDRNAENAKNALRRHLGGVRANARMAVWEL
ncbi:FCD domain-containing protein [Bosea sp. 124]|uniref:FadR/GntR family transcriptional regulator n=1 Tax=Bosea sp. 124 TaxID=2135642 RepID=UPI000D3D26B7|nr:FCD domain-containing protein [Bosea sp. 124]PTM40030.1 DNA-binding FadR family transcriptional regulator [Bosea sp. 124]